MFKELVPGAVGQAHTTLSGGHFLQVTPPPRSTTLLGPVPLPVLLWWPYLLFYMCLMCHLSFLLPLPATHPPPLLSQEDCGPERPRKDDGGDGKPLGMGDLE